MTAEENLRFREDIIKKQFKEKLGYELNLDNPQTFNEKMQWLKLYYNDPLMTKCADKYLAREYIKENIGEEYLIPLLGVWDSPDDIDFESLPNQFVLKVNWGWGQNIIVKDKSKLDIKETKDKLRNWLEPFSNHYYTNLEWQYKNIPPKIVCEKYIEQLDGHLVDYRVLCFNGKAQYIIVDFDAHVFNIDAKFLRAIYDINWNKTDIEIYHPSYNDEVPKPFCFDRMIELAEIISKHFPHIRVDFYVLDNQLFIGELTFSHQNGMGKFKSMEYDHKFGELLILPKEKKIEYDILDRDILVKQYSLLEPLYLKYKQSEDKSNFYLNKYNKLKNNLFSLFGFLNEDDYITIFILGIKIVIKKNY